MIVLLSILQIPYIELAFIKKTDKVPETVVSGTLSVF